MLILTWKKLISFYFLLSSPISIYWGVLKGLQWWFLIDLKTIVLKFAGFDNGFKTDANTDFQRWFCIKSI